MSSLMPVIGDDKMEVFLQKEKQQKKTVYIATARVATRLELKLVLEMEYHM